MPVLSKSAVNEALEESTKVYHLVKDENSSNNDTTVFRTHFKTGDDVMDWLEQYKKETSTEWIVKENRKSVQRVEFHRSWFCQLSKRNKTNASKRNKNCPVVLDVVIKKVNRGTVKNDRDFLTRSPPLNAVITLKEKHNHAICHETLKYLRVSEATKKIFTDYFNDDIGAGEAARLHEAKILLDEDGPTKYADASVNPTRRTVYYLYDQWVEANFGKITSSDPLAKLKEKAEAYAAEGVSVHIDDADVDNWAVLVVTPVMLRAQESTQASEIIFIDSTSSVEFSQSTLTVVLTASPAGAVPICVLIHNAQSTVGYTKAFSLLKEQYPKCFGGKSAPQAFMTDHSDAEKAALKAVWNDVVQFLCFFHVAQSEWRWLMKPESKVPAENRQTLIGLLNQMMYANDLESFEEALEEFLNCGHEGYINHVQKELLDIKADWVKFFRSEVLNRGHMTNNYAEATIRIIKDIVLSRLKAFNVTAMVDFIAHVWDAYFVARLLRYAYGREYAPSLKYKGILSRMPIGFADQIIQVEEGVYWVPSSKNSEASSDNQDLSSNQDTHTYYEVIGSIGWCSCPIGKHGAFCKHQALAHKKYGGLFPNMPPINGKMRYELGKLALGEKCPEPSFFLETNESPFETDVPCPSSRAEGAQEKQVVAEIVAPAQDQEQIFASAHQSTQISDDQIAVMKSTLQNEIERILNLGCLSSSKAVLETTMERLTHRLQKCQNSAQAVTLLVSFSARATCMRKRARINAQVESIKRRREGVTRGAKRLAAGRPPKPKDPSGTASKSKTKARTSKKRQHSLARSIRENKSNPKAHGH